MLDFLTPTTGGLLMLAGGIPPLVAVYLLRNERHKSAVQSFQFAMLSGMVWSVSFGLIALVDTPQIRFAITNFFVVTVPTATIFYFVFCYEFTFKKKAPKAVFVLFVPVALLFVLSWMNPYNLIYTMDDPHLVDEILVPANEGSVRPLITVGMGYLLVTLSSGMVLGELMNTSQRARKIQAVAILLLSLAVGIPGIIKVLNLVPSYFDPTPIGWTVSGLVFTVLIKRSQFLQLSPTAPDQIINNIEDLIIVLNADHVVADLNRAAVEWFDIDIGMTTTEIKRHSPKLAAVIAGSQTSTVEIRNESETRVFDTTDSVFEYGNGAEGTVMILRDVTDREIAEQSLKTTKERYRRIFKRSSDYVIIIDESGRIIDITQGVEYMQGYDPTAVIGTDVFSYAHPNDRETLTDAFEQVRTDPAAELDIEIRAQTVDGSYQWVEARGRNHLDDPLIEGVLLNVRDISQRKEREKELEELTMRLQLALEETDTGVWEWDPSTDEVVWDDASKQLFGYESTTFPGTYAAFAQRVSDDDLAAGKQVVAEAIETGNSFQADYHIELPDGEQRWIQSRGIVEYNGDENVERLLGVHTDITDRKTAEQALEATKERYQHMLRWSSDYVTIVDETETIIDATQGVEHVLGYDLDEVIGSKVLPYIHPEDKRRAFDAFADVTANPDTELNIEYRAQTADGSYCWIACRGRNLLDDPLIEGVLVNVREVSQRKKREQQLAQTTARLKQKNEQLERLAQIVSHDLQTPLSTAEKLVRLLRADLGETDGDVEQSLTDLEATHHRLRGFADHLPRLARESTDVDGPTECDLQTVAESAWNVVDTDALELQIESTRTLRADPERLQRLFENLFQNSVTHGLRAVDLDTHPNTDQDSPKATTVRVGSFDGGFYVEDDGPGVRPEQRDGLFEYGMGTGSGSGFGLAIVRTIAEAHGWAVDVAETTASGVRFNIDTDT